MLGKIMWTRVIGFLLIITIPVGGAYYLLTNQVDEKEIVVKKEKEKVQSEVITHVEQITLSEYPGLELRTETEDTDTYTISISTPIAKEEQLNKPIQQWLTTEKETFIATIEEQTTEYESDLIGHLNIQLSIKEVTDDMYSLVFSLYKYTGGANGEARLKSFTVDVKDNTHLQLSDVIETDEVALEEIRAHIIADLKRDENVQAALFEDLFEGALQDPKQWKWSLSREHFTLHFDQYEIAAGSAGEISVETPLEELTSHLKETIVTAMDMEVVEEPKEVIVAKERELDPNGKYIALTFDDGPSQKVTPRVLEALEKHDAVATFFVLGSQVEFYPAIVEQVARAGHEIGNHSKSHPDFTKFPREFVLNEIKSTNDKVAAITGTKPTLLRPPYGAMNDQVRALSREEEMAIIMWSVDSLDWKNRHVATLSDVTLRTVTDRAVVLMHDIHPTTADALPSLLGKLKAAGYEFVTVSELLQLEKASLDKPFYGKMK